MTTLFDEPRPELHGINRVYNERILPKLEASEDERQRVQKKAIAAGVAGVLAAIAFAVVTFSTVGFFGELQFWIIGGLAFGGIIAGGWMFRHLRAETKSTLVGEVCAHLGWTFSEEADRPDYYGHYVGYRLLRRSDRQSFEDRISGTVHGAEFEMTEMHLEVKHKNNYSTVFRGFAMEVDFHQPFSSTTVVLRDRGMFNAKTLKKRSGDLVDSFKDSLNSRDRSKILEMSRKLKPVGMASPKWEKMFEAYGTDQVEARVKLDPAFMEQLMELEQSVQGKNLRFGFFDNRLHVIVETPNRFEPGSMFKPLADPERMHRLIREVDAIFGVIDAVIKPGSAKRAPAAPAAPVNPYDPDGSLLGRA